MTREIDWDRGMVPVRGAMRDPCPTASHLQPHPKGPEMNPTATHANLASEPATAARPILVTTKHRGVFAGLVPVDQDLSAPTMALREARMAIKWGTTKGLMQLCDTGPTGDSRISAPADIPVLHDITAVFDITPEAWAKWVAA